MTLFIWHCRFFRQYLVLFLVHQMALALFRFIASISRNMVVANTFGTFALVAVFVCSGFVVSRRKPHQSLERSSVPSFF